MLKVLDISKGNILAVEAHGIVRGAVHMFGAFISGEVQLFSNDQLAEAEAEAWIQE